MECDRLDMILHTVTTGIGIAAISALGLGDKINGDTAMLGICAAAGIGTAGLLGVGHVRRQALAEHPQPEPPPVIEYRAPRRASRTTWKRR